MLANLLQSIKNKAATSHEQARTYSQGNPEHMSRSGYDDDCGCDNPWDLIRWRGAVNSAIKGARGQSFLKEMLAALDAMPEKKLIAEELALPDGAVCAMGAVGKARGTDMAKIPADCRDSVAHAFGIAPALAAEIAFENDQDFRWKNTEAPEARFARMRAWVQSQIITPKPGDETITRLDE